VYAYCACRLYRPELAEDATSQVFVEMVECFGDFADKDDAQTCLWLYRRAASVVSNYIRTRQRRAEILKAVARERAAMPDGWIGAHLDWPLLYKAILNLKADQQHVVVLRYFEGMTTSDIARILQIKLGTARVLLLRATRKLRKQLEQRLDA
jgi:RNA polymerase sigma-70 factor (ECF subfamily)